MNAVALVASDGLAARDRAEAVRIAEALLFSARAPLSLGEIAARMPQGTPTAEILADLVRFYAGRGVTLVETAGGFAFRTAADLSYVLSREAAEPRKLSRAAMETLAIVAYHQPVTRAEIEDVRGVATSKGTLDALLEAGWIRLRGRRRTPGRPLTYGTTPTFLDHFGLGAIDDLPGLDDLKGAGFLEGRLSADMAMPAPSDASTLRDDEDPLDDEDLFKPLPPGDGEDGPE
jgi:segregation and condensation protein B